MELDVKTLEEIVKTESLLEKEINEYWESIEKDSKRYEDAFLKFIDENADVPNKEEEKLLKKATTSQIYYGAGTENEKLLFEKRYLDILAERIKTRENFKQFSQETKLKTVIERLNVVIGLLEFMLAAHYFCNKHDREKSREYLMAAEKDLPSSLSSSNYPSIKDCASKTQDEFFLFLQENNLTKKTGSSGGSSSNGGCLIPLIIGIGSICSLLIVLLV